MHVIFTLSIHQFSRMCTCYCKKRPIIRFAFRERMIVVCCQKLPQQKRRSLTCAITLRSFFVACFFPSRSWYNAAGLSKYIHLYFFFDIRSIFHIKSSKQSAIRKTYIIGTTVFHCFVFLLSDKVETG